MIIILACTSLSRVDHVGLKICRVEHSEAEKCEGKAQNIL